MNNRFYALLLSLFILQACNEVKEEVSNPIEDITKLEKLHKAENTVESAQKLLTKYAEYTANNPDDISNNSKYLRRTAQIYNASSEYMKAAGTTVLALKRYYKANATESNIAALIGYYLKLNNQEAAETTMNGYLMAFPNGSKAADYTKDLGDKKQNLQDRLKDISNEVVNTAKNSTGLNNEAVNKFVGVAEIYALTNNTRDTIASDYLFKAGNLAMTTNNMDKAIECFTWLYSWMDDSKEAPKALFTHAFMLDTQLNKREEAKGLYETFLEKYPNHHFANDAKFTLNNLGKDDAEIIQEFNKKD